MRRLTIGLLLGVAVGICNGKGAESMRTEFAAGTFGYGRRGGRAGRALVPE